MSAAIQVEENRVIRNESSNLPGLANYSSWKGGESIAKQVASEKLKDRFICIPYDVTTLYFESFKPYDLRTSGFSTDYQPQLQQIVNGFLVTQVC